MDLGWGGASLYKHYFFSTLVDLEPVNEQKKRINALENNEETTSSDVPNLNQLAKKTRGKLLCISSGLALIPEIVLPMRFYFFFKNKSCKSRKFCV